MVLVMARLINNVQRLNVQADLNTSLITMMEGKADALWVS